MRVITVGATGRIGRTIVTALAADKFITKVVSLEATTNPIMARPRGEQEIERCNLDLTDDLSDRFRFADAVVYVGWPVVDLGNDNSHTHHLAILENVCESVASAGVSLFVFGSSIGVYSPAPVGQLVEESWPTLGRTSLPSSLQMADGERLVDRLEAAHPLIRVIRLRAGLIACPTAGIRRMTLLGRRIVATALRARCVPDLGPHVLQIVHVADLAQAFCLAVTQSALGSFNITAGPISSDLVAQNVGATTVPISLATAIELLSFARELGLHSIDPQRIQLALEAPLVDTTRALSLLGWKIDHSITSMMEEWTECLETRAVRTRPAQAERHPREPAAPVDYPILYEQSLEFFGSRVHTVQIHQWQEPTEFRGMNVWQLIAFVAREQYRTALRLRSNDHENPESELPQDPLGFSRVDGWDLAAEKGTLAVEARAQVERFMKDTDTDRLLSSVLRDVICDNVILGMCLSRAIGTDEDPGSALLWFVRERLCGFDTG